ncbi:uncharacterized protein LOC131882025 [Tigriopus californicus]|uniref:uncharacterized protein LOC131882025 n=1 Tax=Tigriopus californicus TaxID=6832 RepID=UPI0027DA3304|nr:uncharacterized protein LOC131882025 [Tigriopus californicus]XP_059085028.1 uncharacterized protein LOC131882025 [Tigriopus californicus]
MHLEFHFGKADTAATTADPNATHPLAKEYQGKFQGVVPGLQFYNNSVFFDLSYYLLFSQLRYVTRVPQKTVAFGNVARGFDQLGWLAVFITLGCFALTFELIFYLYKFKIKDKSLYNNPGNPVDFFLLTFTTFVEPDKINWFPTWSVGKLMTLLWSVFALLVVSFYTSNLRTNLIAPNLEPEINSHEDVLKYDMTVHADHLLSFLLQLTVSPAFDEILRRMKDQDKWYHPIESQLLEAHVKKAVLEDGEVYLATAENILYSYLLQDTLGFPHLRISDDSLVNFYMCLRLTKFSPYTPDINKLFIINHEFGLHKRFLNMPIPTKGLPSTGSTAQYESSDNLRMTLEMLWTSVFLLISGSVIGGIIFIIEIMMARSWRKVDRFSQRIS